MSIESAWELRCKSSPRSLCVYNAAATSAETNPFEVAAGADTRTAQAVVFGSEKGSLHYRTYYSESSGTLKAPLGSTTSRTNNNLPRAYLPVDLPEGSLPGAVVAVIRATDAPSHRPIFLVLIDDNKGSSSSSSTASQPGMYAATLVTLQHGSFSKLSTPTPLPRISSATYHVNCGFVVCTGRRIQCIQQEVFLDVPKSRNRKKHHRVDFSGVVLPPPGSRGGQDALTVIHNGKVAVVAVGNVVLAIPDGASSSGDFLKVASFSQSSQIHPVICLDMQDKSMDPDWSSLFLANGREACVVDLQLDAANSSISCAPPRTGTITLASPILAAATSWPWLAVLTSDGLISIRSPSCLAIPLKMVEMGTRPNDFFVMRTYQEDSHKIPWVVCMSYSGEAKALQCQPDTRQDLADRLMRHSIDAFGSNGFPRSELAEAVNASFTATSYVGPEPTPHARDLLRQYLEAILGLADFEGGASSGWPTEMSASQTPVSSPKTSAYLTSAFEEASSTQNHSTPLAESSPVVTAETPEALLCGTALLCLVCTMLSPQPKASLANRAAKACAAKMGVVVSTEHKSAARVNASIAGQLLDEFSQKPQISLTGSVSQKKFSSHLEMEFVEAATWLLRSCGNHERAIDALYEKLQQHRSPERSFPESGFWSQIKYESYTATHLSELWSTSDENACKLVLQSPATKRLLEKNPVLGLNVFIVLHPQNAGEWKQLNARDDPLASNKYPAQVIRLLKSINPSISYAEQQTLHDDDDTLPMNSGRALAVAFLESAIGINSKRPTEEDEFDSLAPDESFEERIADYHDELCYLLLEGLLSERGDDYPQKNEDSTPLGRNYRQRLRRLLRWPSAKVRSERLMNNLPTTFLQEHALVLGRLGRHEDALKILYVECKSMDLALEYCDLRYEQQEARREAERARLAARGLLDDQRDDDKFSKREGCAYLPLVRVALESDPDKERGTTAAIQVLALRRSAIDRAAALRLLPKNVPVSAVARPFLIPALVESESQARRLRVVSSLLRARHIALKQQLTDAQLKAQAHLHVVPQLRSMNFGDPLHSTKPLKVKPSASASATFPEVVIIKYLFPRHVVIQAKITNSSGVIDGRALGNVAFVVAESSEEGIQPMNAIPIKVLPFGSTGSCWFVMVANPNRMEGTAILTCELRYTVLGVDATTGAPLSFGHGSTGRTFVEELQDLEILPSYFS
jgi:hypothetical protein